MRKMIKNKNGITLIVLVITIILLIILAGITISLVLGPNGIIVKAQYAKMQSEISGEKEQLGLAVTEARVDNTGEQPTLGQIKDKIVEKKIATEDNIKTGENRLQVTTPKNHTYTIGENENIEYVGEGEIVIPDLTSATVAFKYTPSTWTNGNVQVEITTTVTGYTLQYSTDGSTWNSYTSAIIVTSNKAIYARLWDGINYGGTTTGNVTNIDKVSPTLTISTTNTTNSIAVTATGADNESGIAGYKYSKDNGSTWTDLITDNVYTFTGLTQGQVYPILVQVYDKAGNTASKNESVTTGSVSGLTSENTTFTYTPSTWTNGNVQVGIATTVTGYTLQYSTDGSTWNPYTNVITVTSNEAIYARLWDGTNYGGTASGNIMNIDKVSPTLTISTTNTTNSIAITATGIDNESGITGYKYSKDNGNTWTDLITDNVYTFTGLTQGQLYQIVVQVYDQAGNMTTQNASVTTGTVTGLTSANTTFTYTPSTWTNGNVQVSINTTVTGYTLQYSTDGSTWNPYTSAITITSNQAIYARLWDGANYGGTATGNVTNIDNTNPILTLNQDAGTTARTITINATDTQSGINTIQYNNAGTWQNLTTSNITNGKSATQAVYLNGTYTFRTIDNVGYTTSQSITVTGVTPLISNLRGGPIISSTDNIALKDDEGHMITVPAGFKIASDSATIQENGVVIQDSDGNQFVWIPVASISNYVRVNFQTAADYSNYSETMPSDEQTSVSTYHGYYIGRYEAGDSVITASGRLRGYDSVTDKVAISKGQAPYNYITRDQSKTLAEGMDTAEGYKAKTKLCSSYAWDTAIAFIQNRVAGYGTSSSQGNYLNVSFNYTNITGSLQNKAANVNTLVPTGQTTPVCNIYDMGGNDWEWTTEVCSVASYPCTYRGGSSGFNYTADPAGWRCYDSSTYKNVGVAFRITMYL